MKKEIFRKLITIGALACAVSASHAAVVDAWDYTFEMAWTDAVFNTKKHSNFTSLATPTMLSWGREDSLDDYLGKGNQRSSLFITDPHGEGTVLTGSSVSRVNMFRHTNGYAWQFTSLREVTLSVSVGLSAHGSTVPIETLNKDFKIYFLETPNIPGTCAWGTCSDDLLVFAAMPQIYDLITYDGVDYMFQYFQTSGPDAIKMYDADICSMVSGGKLTTSCYGFQTMEAAQTTLQFGFSITAVPEPETYAMLLAGLGIVGVVARRQRDTLRS